MKVWFPGETAQESLRFGVLLTPGENEVDDEKGAKMIACGIVSKVKGLSVKELKIGKEPRDS